MVLGSVLISFFLHVAVQFSQHYLLKRLSLPHCIFVPPLSKNKVPIGANIRWIMEKEREFQKTSISALLTMPKPLTVWITRNCGKFMKEMGIPDHLICLLRNLYAGQEAIVRTGHGKTDWVQIGKGVHQGCILSSCLFNLYAENIMRNAGLEEHKLESRLPGEISITSDTQMTPPLWQKLKRC